jgi:ubiquinone/menaquinone biosynthesis C-methylase UbiE
MPDYEEIYEREAERYEVLVSAEDAAGELPRALARLVELGGARVIELGMGTGRVTRMLLDGGASVIGYERSSAMLDVARRRLGSTFRAVLADVREVALPAKSAEIALAGWCFGHFCQWSGERWRDDIGAVLGKMWGALDDGGTLIVIETLGTGVDVARPPNAELAAYYGWLERDWGMRREQLPTDYRFETVEAACESIGFFFGPELEARVRERGSCVVPEWTGLWWKKKAAQP